MKRGEPMNNLTIFGKTTVCGIEIPKIAGGFGPDKPAMLTNDIAKLHNTELKKVNQDINRNRDKFKDGIDIIDLKNSVTLSDPLLQAGILSKQSIANSANIYLLSARGYTKLLKIFNDDLSWDKHDQVMDEYFEMKESQFPIPHNFAEALRIAADQWEQNQKLLTDNIELKSELTITKPKAEYLDKILQNPGTMTVTQIAKDYGMTAPAFNKLLHSFLIQYKHGDNWHLYDEYAKFGYTQSYTIDIENDKGAFSKANMNWTQAGRKFLYGFLKEKGILPHCELAIQKLSEND
jgi:Uncharacterized phage-encoded protein